MASISTEEIEGVHPRRKPGSQTVQPAEWWPRSLIEVVCPRQGRCTATAAATGRVTAAV